MAAETVFLRATLIAGIAVTFAALLAISSALGPMAARRYRLISPPPLANLDTKILDVVTLGYRGLWDDVAAIWSLQVLLDQRLKSEDLASLNAMLLMIARHGPKVESFYTISCYVLALDLNQAGPCEPLMLAGMRALPMSWRLPATMGSIASLKLQDYQRAAMYFGLAATRPGAPPLLLDLAQRTLANHQLDPNVIVHMLSTVISDTRLHQLSEMLSTRIDKQEGPKP